MMDQKHKAAMNQLEKEMELEMQRQRTELNEQMEAELAAELEVHGTLSIKTTSSKGPPLHEKPP